MAVINRYKATYTTDNTRDIVPDFTIQTTYGRSVCITVKNIGNNVGQWSVYGGNEPDLSDIVVVKEAVNITDGYTDSYSSEFAVFEYYAVYVSSQTEDVPTILSLNAIVKN